MLDRAKRTLLNQLEKTEGQGTEERKSWLDPNAKVGRSVVFKIKLPVRYSNGEIFDAMFAVHADSERSAVREFLEKAKYGNLSRGPAPKRGTSVHLDDAQIKGLNFYFTP